jgi:hypothetical protein
VSYSRFYLGNTGYINTGYILIPFRRTRYHLRKIITAGEVPETYKELFNLRYSVLRNEVKYIFGVLKRCFPFLKANIEYNLLTQIQVIFAICTLYNFIRQDGILEDNIFENEDNKINKPEEANKEEALLIIY